MKIVAGVDCHKHVHVVAFVDPVGKVLEEFEIPANEVGYEEAIARSRAYSACIWGLEGAHSYGRGFADALVAIDAYIFEVPGAFTKRHRRKWKSKFGGLEVSDVAKMRSLEDENRRLKRLLADSALEIDALKLIASGNF